MHIKVLEEKEDGGIIFEGTIEKDQVEFLISFAVLTLLKGGVVLSQMIKEQDQQQEEDPVQGDLFYNHNKNKAH